MMTKTPVLKIQRTTKQNFFTLNLPDSELDPESQSPDIFKKRKTETLKKHARLKILQKPKCLKEATLVLSIDFIYNEHNFWNEEFIDEPSIKTWKSLSALINMIWIVRRESSFKKLISFASSFNLRLDGVVQVQSNKK